MNTVLLLFPSSIWEKIHLQIKMCVFVLFLFGQKIPTCIYVFLYVHIPIIHMCGIINMFVSLHILLVHTYEY